jgi:hypothetical protein
MHALRFSELSVAKLCQPIADGKMLGLRSPQLTIADMDARYGLRFALSVNARLVGTVDLDAMAGEQVPQPLQIAM